MIFHTYYILYLKELKIFVLVCVCVCPFSSSSRRLQQIKEYLRVTSALIRTGPIQISFPLIPHTQYTSQ